MEETPGKPRGLSGLSAGKRLLNQESKYYLTSLLLINYDSLLAINGQPS